MKRLLAGLVAAALLLACSAQEAPQSVREELPSPESVPPESSGEIIYPLPDLSYYREFQGPPLRPSKPLLDPISREEAGLDLIPARDFSAHALNPDLSALALSLHSYGDADMARGLTAFIRYKTRYGGDDCQSCLVITERYGDAIIDGLSVGSTRSEIIAALGEPSLEGVQESPPYLEAGDRPFQEAWWLFYKAEGYYLGFMGLTGEAASRCAVLEMLPVIDYPQDLLKQMLEVLPQGDMGLYFHLAPEGFFTYASAGGFLQSDYGVEWTGYWERGPTLWVYNNYAGNLYGIRPRETQQDLYELRFVNTDPHIAYGVSQMALELEIDQRGTPAGDRYVYYFDGYNTHFRDTWRQRGEFTCPGQVQWVVPGTGYIVGMPWDYNQYLIHIDDIGREDAGVDFPGLLGLRREEDWPAAGAWRIVGVRGDQDLLVWDIPGDGYLLIRCTAADDGSLEFALLDTWDQLPEEYGESLFQGW